MFKFFFDILLLLIISWRFSAEASENFYQHQTWLKLSGYYRIADGWHSHIKNADYFIANNGSIDPAAELAAFINLAERSRFSREAAKIFCRYPARAAFLKQQKIIAHSAEDTCADSDNSRLIKGVNSISLIFADGYFGNPASYYGHVLLKLNGDSILKAGDAGLLDIAINYGANVPPNENAITYIGKGVFGFYTGSFQTNKFFLNTVQYADQQSRDFWIYDLALSPEQAKHIARRVIEWKRAEFDYYFFGDNCAHRVRDLIEETINRPVANDNGIWMMPMQVLTGVSKVRTDSMGPLVKSIRYLPATKTKLFAILTSFNRKSLAALDKFLDGDDTLLASLSQRDQKKALIAADLHLRQLISDREAKAKTKTETDDRLNALKERRQQVLLSLLKLRNIASEIPVPPVPTNPHLSGRHGTALSLGLTYSKAHGAVQAATIRPAYTDYLANDIGKIPDSTLHMGQIHLTRVNQITRLERLTFIEIENLRAAKVDRRFDPGRVWHLSAGIARDNYVLGEPLLAFFSLGIGYNRLLGPRANFYAMAKGNVGESSARFDTFSPSTELGLITGFGEATKIAITQKWKMKNDETYDSKTDFRLRTAVSANLDLGFSYEYAAEDRRLSISFLRYF
jgi:hypothetical protein